MPVFGGLNESCFFFLRCALFLFWRGDNLTGEGRYIKIKGRVGKLVGMGRKF